MTGDQADCLARIKGLLPPWFGQAGGVDTPILDAFLSGPAWALAWVYELYAYAALQTRLATATDGWLDLIAQDFFGAEVRRTDDEDDDTFRRRIQTTILAERTTPAAIVAALTALTGNVPVISAEGDYAATITIDPGTVPEAEVEAAVDALRPICFVPDIVFT